MNQPNVKTRWMIVGAISSWCGMSSLELYKRWPDKAPLWALLTLAIILSVVYIADEE